MLVCVVFKNNIWTNIDIGLTIWLIHSRQSQSKDQAQQALVSPSQLPEEGECLTVPKYKRDLVQKLKILRQELSQHQPQAGHCRIEVSREEIFEVRKMKSFLSGSSMGLNGGCIFSVLKDPSREKSKFSTADVFGVLVLQESYRQVMKMRPKDLWKRLMVKFRGEEGLDYGGVAR